MPRMSIDEKKFFAKIRGETLWVLGRINEEEMHPLTLKALSSLGEISNSFMQLITTYQNEDKEDSGG